MTRSLETDILYTLLYIGFLSFMLWKHQKQTDNHWGAGSVILLSYLIYPIVGAFWFFQPIPNHGEVVSLQFFPFVYLALMFWIASAPVRQYDKEEITEIEPPTMKFLLAFSFIYIACTLIYIPNLVQNIIDGLHNIIIDPDAGLNKYLETAHADKDYDSAIRNLPAIIFNVFSPLVFFLFFYFLTLEKRVRWVEIGFSICIIFKTFASLSNGQRGEATMSLLNILIAYFLVKPMLSDKIRHIMNFVLVGLAIMFIIPFMALTFSRFGELEGGAFDGITYYIGEAPYYFNNYALSEQEHRHGDRTCNMFKKLIGMPAPDGVDEVRAKYHTMNMDDSIFSSFVGDFVLDFGAVTAFILFVVFSFLFKRVTRSNGPNKIPFHRLILVFFAASVCMQGGMCLFSYAFEYNLQILAIVVFYVFFGLEYLLRHRQEIKINK